MLSQVRPRVIVVMHAVLQMTTVMNTDFNAILSIERATATLKQVTSIQKGIDACADKLLHASGMCVVHRNEGRDMAAHGRYLQHHAEHEARKRRDGSWRIDGRMRIDG